MKIFRNQIINDTVNASHLTENVIRQIISVKYIVSATSQFECMPQIESRINPIKNMDDFVFGEKKINVFHVDRFYVKIDFFAIERIKQTIFLTNSAFDLTSKKLV